MFNVHLQIFVVLFFVCLGYYKNNLYFIACKLKFLFLEIQENLLESIESWKTIESGIE